MFMRTEAVDRVIEDIQVEAEKIIEDQRVRSVGDRSEALVDKALTLTLIARSLHAIVMKSKELNQGGEDAHNKEEADEKENPEEDVLGTDEILTHLQAQVTLLVKTNNTHNEILAELVNRVKALEAKENTEEDVLGEEHF